MENKCSNCGKPLPQGAVFCMHCFTLNSKKLPPDINGVKKKKTALIIISLVVIICLCGAAVFSIGKARFAKEEKNATSPSTTVKASEIAAPSTSVTAALTTAEASTNAQTKPETTATQTTSAPETTTATTTTATQPTAESTTKPKKETTKATKPKEKTAKKVKKKTTKAQSSEIIIENGVLKKYPSSRKSSSYTVPYEVKEISKDAFKDNKYLKTLKFSKRADLKCNWDNLFASLSGLETIYIYAGTSADTQGMQFFTGEIVYYYD